LDLVHVLAADGALRLLLVAGFAAALVGFFAAGFFFGGAPGFCFVIDLSRSLQKGHTQSAGVPFALALACSSGVKTQARW